LSLRTKAEVVFVALFLVGISAFSVMSVTRTITDSSDTIDTYIRNSNGKYWEVTEANLATALADAGAFGYVWVGDDITLTSKINFSGLVGGDGITLDFQGHNVTVPTGCSFINITNNNYATVKNVNIIVNSGLTYPTDAGLDNHEDIIEVFGKTDVTRVDFLELSNIYIDNRGEMDQDANPLGGNAHYYHNWTGIYLNVETDGDTARINSCVFRDIVIEGCNIGIKLETSVSSYINANLFDNIYFNQYQVGISFRNNGSNGINENLFRHIKGQTGAYSEYGVFNIGGTDNNFKDMLFFDWNTATINLNGVYIYNISTKSVNTVIDDNSRNTISYILDDGKGSIVRCGNRDLYYDSDYDYKVTTDGTYYYVTLGDYGDMPPSGTYAKKTDFENLMLNILAHNDIVVVIGEGVFIPDQNINIVGRNITIKGTGKHNTMIRGVAGTSYNAGFFNMVDVSTHNITIENIVFDGVGLLDTSYGMRFGVSQNMNGLTVDDCIFKDWTAGTSKAIHIPPSSDDTVINVNIRNCEFYNCDYGVSIDGDADPSYIKYSDVSNNYFRDCQFSIYCDYIFNSTISNNRIISNVASSDGITLSNCIDNIIDGNLVIVVDDGIVESGNADFNMIYGNNCQNSGDPLTTTGGGTVVDNIGSGSAISNSNDNWYPATEDGLQSAIVDAGNNSWVECPVGTIAVTGDVQLTEMSNIRITGYGTELEVTDSTSFAGGGLFSLYDCEGVVIEGFELDGNHPWNTSASDAYAGINIRKTSNSTFRDCEIHHVLGDGIVFSDATEATPYDENSFNNLITHNNLHHIGDVEDTTSPGDAGIRIMGVSLIENNTISYNTIDMVREHGIKVYGYAAIGATKYYIHDNNKILNNIISNACMGNWDKSNNVYGRGIAAYGNGTLVSGNTIYCNGLMEHGIIIGRDVIVDNNHIYFIEDSNQAVYGIYAQHTVAVNPDSAKITKNFIDGGNYANAGGIGIADDVYNVICTDNIINYVTRAGISAKCLYSDISHNIINVTGSDAIWFDGDYTTISYNRLTSAGDDAISVDNINYCDISHNTAYDANDEGMVLYGTCTYSSITNNKFINPGQDGIVFLGGSSYAYMDVSHNTVENDWSYALDLDNVDNSVFGFNILDNGNNIGINEDADCDKNIFIGNNADNSAVAWSMSGTNQQNTTNIPAMD